MFSSSVIKFLTSCEVNPEEFGKKPCIVGDLHLERIYHGSSKSRFVMVKELENTGEMFIVRGMMDTSLGLQNFAIHLEDFAPKADYVW